MKKENQTTKMDAVRINRDFYYTLALLQYEAINFIARAENDDNKLERAKTIIEQVKKIIDTIDPQPDDLGTCLPPCYPDKLQKFCICPHEGGKGGTHIDPTDLVVVDG